MKLLTPLDKAILVWLKSKGMVWLRLNHNETYRRYKAFRKNAKILQNKKERRTKDQQKSDFKILSK